MKKNLFVLFCILLCCVQIALSQSKTNRTCSHFILEIISFQEVNKTYKQQIDDSLGGEKNKFDSEESNFAFTWELLNKIHSVKDISSEEIKLLEEHIEEIQEKAIFAFKQRLKNTLPFEKWLNQSVQNRCQKMFSSFEIRKLISFYKTAKGRKIIQILDKTLIFALNKQKMEFSRDEKDFLPLVDKFVETPLGKKFLKTFLVKGIMDDLSKNYKVWVKIQPSGFEIEVPKIIKEILKSDTQ
jgi:hypothetical protein